ncbi:MAG: thiamine phosphate synthase [Candidatus Azobacteroides sp.]|nr:thiamine phosphate synthase [Candidatus Azobacteroides sp.]
MDISALELYLVTDRGLSCGRPLVEVVQEAVKGGVTMVQLREKEASSREFYELAVELKKLLLPWQIPLIINDRLDIALACDAEGLHIGQSDLPYPVARHLLGKNKIIGLSVENLRDVRQANDWEVDYIGISPVFGTSTKTDTAPPVGLEGVRRLTKESVHPAVGIGGINLSNARQLIEAGAKGVSVVSAIMSAPSPREAAEQIRNELRKARQ